MINLVKKFFSGSAPVEKGEKKGDPTHDIHVATCALFLEMANIDGEFSDSEKEHMIRTLEREYDLSHEYVIELMEASKSELEGSVDLWQFTNLINQNYSLEEKLQVIEVIWELAYVDGKLDSHEDYLVHKCANLLRLTQKQLIAAKMKVLSSAKSSKMRGVKRRHT